MRTPVHGCQQIASNHALIDVITVLGEIDMITQFPGVIFTFNELKFEHVLRYHPSDSMHSGL